MSLYATRNNTDVRTLKECVILMFHRQTWRDSYSDRSVPRFAAHQWRNVAPVLRALGF